MSVVIQTYITCPDCRRWDRIEVFVNIPAIVFRCDYCSFRWEDEEEEEYDPMWGPYLDRQERLWPSV